MGHIYTATLHAILAAGIVVTTHAAPRLQAQTATLLASTQQPHFPMRALNVLRAAQSDEAASQRCLPPLHAGGWQSPPVRHRRVASDGRVAAAAPEVRSCLVHVCVGSMPPLAEAETALAAGLCKQLTKAVMLTAMRM
jgi:hypothetical protein